MNKQDKRYWLEQLDRFGLFFFGIFLGGVIETMGIPRLSIVISIAFLLVIGVISILIKREKEKYPYDKYMPCSNPERLFKELDEEERSKNENQK